MFENYTKEARTTIVYAKREAFEFGSSELTAEHILLALLNDEAIAGQVVDVRSLEQIRSRLFALLGGREREAVGRDGHVNSSG